MKLFAVLLCVAGLAFASGTFSGAPGGTGGGSFVPETDDQLDSYAYSAAEQMSTIGASFGDYAAIDDFTPPYDAGYLINTYTGWAVTTGSTPTTLELLVVADASGLPSGAPISQVGYPTTCGNTGFTYGGYPIWLAEITVGGLNVDSPVWLGHHRAGADTWYPVGGLTVTGSEGYRTTAAGWAWAPFSAELEPGDLFKVIDGTPVSLSRTTWAGIKNLF